MHTRHRACGGIRIACGMSFTSAKKKFEFLSVRICGTTLRSPGTFRLQLHDVKLVHVSTRVVCRAREIVVCANRQRSRVQRRWPTRPTRAAAGPAHTSWGYTVVSTFTCTRSALLLVCGGSAGACPMYPSVYCSGGEGRPETTVPNSVTGVVNSCLSVSRFA